MAKQIEITTGFLGEEYTIKVALKHYLEEQRNFLKDMTKHHGLKIKFVPNQHIIMADIKNCKLLLKKLENNG